LFCIQVEVSAFRACAKGDIEAADAYGLSGWSRFRRVIWPTMLRLAWPAYTNEAIFIFHATTLVYFLGFSAWKQKGDAPYYASSFADKTLIPYPILAMYFIMLTMLVISLYSLINTRLNKHLELERRQKVRFKPQILR